MLILKGHKGMLRAVAFSPDGEMLASAAGGGMAVSLWNAARGKRIAFLGGHPSRVCDLAFGPTSSGLLAVSCAANQGIYLWDLKTRGIRSHFQLYRSSPALCISRDGSMLAATLGGYSHHDAQLWNLSTGKSPTILDFSSHSTRSVIEGDTYAIAFSPDGGTLAVSKVIGTNLWDVGSLRITYSMPQQFPARSVAFSPDGRTLATSSRSKVLLWNVADGTLRTTLEGHEKTVNAVAFLPDGQTLVTGGNDGIVRLWDVASGMLRHAFDWGVGKVLALAISPDGMRAAVGGVPNIVICDLDEG